MMLLPGRSVSLATTQGPPAGRKRGGERGDVASRQQHVSTTQDLPALGQRERRERGGEGRLPGTSSVPLATTQVSDCRQAGGGRVGEASVVRAARTVRAGSKGLRQCEMQCTV